MFPQSKNQPERLILGVIPTKRCIVLFALPAGIVLIAWLIWWNISDLLLWASGFYTICCTSLCIQQGLKYHPVTQKKQDENKSEGGQSVSALPLAISVQMNQTVIAGKKTPGQLIIENRAAFPVTGALSGLFPPGWIVSQSEATRKQPEEEFNQPSGKINDDAETVLFSLKGLEKTTQTVEIIPSKLPTHPGPFSLKQCIVRYSAGLHLFQTIANQPLQAPISSQVVNSMVKPSKNLSLWAEQLLFGSDSKSTTSPKFKPQFKPKSPLDFPKTRSVYYKLSGHKLPVHKFAGPFIVKKQHATKKITAKYGQPAPSDLLQKQHLIVLDTSAAMTLPYPAYPPDPDYPADFVFNTPGEIASIKEGAFKRTKPQRKNKKRTASPNCTFDCAIAVARALSESGIEADKLAGFGLIEQTGYLPLSATPGNAISRQKIQAKLMQTSANAGFLPDYALVFSEIERHLQQTGHWGNCTVYLIACFSDADAVESLYQNLPGFLKVCPLQIVSIDPFSPGTANHCEPLLQPTLTLTKAYRASVHHTLQAKRQQALTQLSCINHVTVHSF
ncbi:MAG: hypothetical protein AAGI66_03805 [Cyanobacteria bacterium P01_H01_bin.74]